MEKLNFDEVLFNRIETKEPGNSKEESVLTITFERVRVLKSVMLTQDQANILNDGRAGHPGNTSFTLFLNDSDADPEPIVRKMVKAASGPVPLSVLDKLEK